MRRANKCVARTISKDDNAEEETLRVAQSICQSLRTYSPPSLILSSLPGSTDLH